MNSIYNIPALFQMAFGLQPPYQVNTERKGNDTAIHYQVGIKEVAPNEAERLSKMGTPIVFPVKFESGNYQFYNKNSQIEKRNVSDFWFPPATMVDFSRAKNITKTNVIGGSGTVKEIYGLDDWSIRIRTLCIADELSEREYERRIIEWANVVESIPVVGDLFTKKDIFNIVIESIDIQSLEGMPKVIPIELNCVSDEPFEIIYR